LERWNRKINLTSLSFDNSPDESLDRLLLEPLVAVRVLKLASGLVLDVGSGSGSPALPMKLAAPSIQLTMVESKIRKAAFLREAIRRLDLAGTEVLTARFEELLTRPNLHEAVDLITIRAVRLERKSLLTLQAFLRPGGRLAMFRGMGPEPPVPIASVLVNEGSLPLVESSGARVSIFRKV
jgi:16S rRNA (guanine527-N7)-methyltransferase